MSSLENDVSVDMVVADNVSVGSYSLQPLLYRPCL